MIELAKSQSAARTILTFRVRGRLYGLEVNHVREVSTHFACTPVPLAPPLVRGLANIRSRIYLVLDAGIATGSTPADCTAESRLIVLHPGVAENLGLLVEHGGDIVQVPADQVEPAVAAGARESSDRQACSPVVALCKLDEVLVMLIDPARVVAALESAIR